MRSVGSGDLPIVNTEVIVNKLAIVATDKHQMVYFRLSIIIKNTLDYIFIFHSNFTGFEKPSAIQQRAIKPIVKGRDVIAQ